MYDIKETNNLVDVKSDGTTISKSQSTTNRDKKKGNVKTPTKHAFICLMERKSDAPFKCDLKMYRDSRRSVNSQSSTSHQQITRKGREGGIQGKVFWLKRERERERERERFR